MLPILVVLFVGLFVGFVWQLIRGAFESSLDKARSRTAQDAQANMQLASGNYLATESDEVVPVEAMPIEDVDSSINLKKDSTISKNND